ncbi:Mg2 transporter protein CorA family protein [Leptothrix cholodnii SP-6]|uniref:Mg2 transporter protein CorA family protein n=1 Tax=Leptothrix cholodnii (strain ATCC 51168 / LMG 8142 / SP-6) TaxID=395495 RepID=B1Y4X6_LEPCP|nr:CorA family divalent cation transporter [Leptothrix cholodnii]ACB35872.1 Mg2 transporter protein CorA family protein [Leptothrix cholodnii SP-6]
MIVSSLSNALSRKEPARPGRASTAEATFGSDAAGLICGYLFAPTATPIGAEAAAAWLKADLAADDGTPAPDSFLWLHFNLADKAAERWLAEHTDLAEAFFDTLRGGLHSTRVERVEQTLLAVVNDLQFDFAFEPSDTATLWICLNRRLVVTGRRKPLRSVDQLRVSVRDGEPVRSSADLLAQLLRHQVDVLGDLARQMTNRVDEVEDRLLSGRLEHKRARLGAMRRLLVRLQRLLLPEPAALFRLLQHPPPWMTETDVQDLRDATEEFSVVLRDMVALQERVKLLQEEVAAQVNEQTGRSLFVLTVVTVLALPINIIAGLLGMNVGGIPLAEHAHGFLIIVGIVITFMFVAGWWAFRKKNDD